LVSLLVAVLDYLGIETIHADLVEVLGWRYLAELVPSAVYCPTIHSGDHLVLKWTAQRAQNIPMHGLAHRFAWDLVGVVGVIEEAAHDRNSQYRGVE